MLKQTLSNCNAFSCILWQFCATIKPPVRVLRLLLCLSGELSEIFGLGARFLTIFGLTDGRPDKPVEPMFFSFCYRHLHTGTGDDRSRWMAAKMRLIISRQTAGVSWPHQTQPKPESHPEVDF